MADRTVTFKGAPLPVEGSELKPGDKAPDFKLQVRSDAGLEDVSLANFAGKTVILSVVPSLDTSVCALQTKKFNERATQLPDNVAILTASMDLPFAQARFCGAEGINKIQVASAHRDANFGKAYGALISGGPLERILARSIFVIGPDGRLKYVEYVPELTNEPNYDAALAAAAG
ncbi:MAG TPA: thiol peroxidase [Chthonomonadaceae bacterium]|nr:thiol peroxidase [Chthonomonadaceae bacterium]